jgi:hypothetical protein
MVTVMGGAQLGCPFQEAGMRWQRYLRTDGGRERLLVLPPSSLSHI